MIQKKASTFTKRGTVQDLLRGAGYEAETAATRAFLDGLDLIGLAEIVDASTSPVFAALAKVRLRILY